MKAVLYVVCCLLVAWSGVVVAESWTADFTGAPEWSNCYATLAEGYVAADPQNPGLQARLVVSYTVGNPTASWYDMQTYEMGEVPVVNGVATIPHDAPGARTMYAECRVWDDFNQQEVVVASAFSNGRNLAGFMPGAGIALHPQFSGIGWTATVEERTVWLSPTSIEPFQTVKVFLDGVYQGNLSRTAEAFASMPGYCAATVDPSAGEWTMELWEMGAKLQEWTLNGAAAVGQVWLGSDMEPYIAGEGGPDPESFWMSSMDVIGMAAWIWTAGAAALSMLIVWLLVRWVPRIFKRVSA